MDLSKRYTSTGDLPATIPVFPLDGALLLPRAQLPLNVFEPRYLDMITAALAGDRLVGMIQTLANPGKDQGSDAPRLHSVGCVGRITSYAEAEDDRFIITLTGICRFAIVREVSGDGLYRMVEASYDAYARDLVPGNGQDDVNRRELLDTFRAFLDANDLRTDWDEIHKASNEALVNTLSVISPYEPAEKQALLEADSLKDRADVLIALTEMALARQGITGESGLQ